MALIKCPECGQQISSAAERCVHCGFTFTICPDCGEVLSGGTAVCPNCGCALQKNIKQSAPVSIPAKSAVSVSAATASEKDTEVDGIVVAATLDNLFNKQKRTFKIVNIVLETMSVLFVAIGVLIVTVWCNKDILEKIISFDKTKNGASVLLWMGAVVFAIGMAVTFFDEEILIYMFKKKAEREKFDLYRYLLKHGNDFGLEKKSFEMYLQVCYWQENKKAEIGVFAKDIIASLLWFAIAICLGIFFTESAESIMEMSLANSKINFKNLNYTSLIVAAVFFGINIVIMFVHGVFLTGGFDKYAEAYMKKIGEDNQQ